MIKGPGIDVIVAGDPNWWPPERFEEIRQLIEDALNGIPNHILDKVEAAREEEFEQ